MSDVPCRREITYTCEVTRHDRSRTLRVEKYMEEYRLRLPLVSSRLETVDDPPMRLLQLLAFPAIRAVHQPLVQQCNVWCQNPCIIKRLHWLGDPSDVATRCTRHLHRSPQEGLVASRPSPWTRHQHAGPARRRATRGSSLERACSGTTPRCNWSRCVVG